jgi:hypothetical protein
VGFTIASENRALTEGADEMLVKLDGFQTHYLFSTCVSSRPALTFLGAAHSILRFAAWLKFALWPCR